MKLNRFTHSSPFSPKQERLSTRTTMSPSGYANSNRSTITPDKELVKKRLVMASSVKTRLRDKYETSNTTSVVSPKSKDSRRKTQPASAVPSKKTLLKTTDSDMDFMERKVEPVSAPPQNISKPQIQPQAQPAHQLQEVEDDLTVSFHTLSMSESYCAATPSEQEASSEAFSEIPDDVPETIHNFLAYPVTQQRKAEETKQVHKVQLSKPFVQGKFIRKNKAQKIKEQSVRHNWPELEWEQQRALQKKYEDSLINQVLLKRKISLLESVLKSYKRSCEKLKEKEKLPEQDPGALAPIEELEGKEEGGMAELPVDSAQPEPFSEEKNTQTTEKYVPMAEYQTVSNKLELATVLLDTSLSFVTSLLEESGGETEKEHRENVHRIEKELEQLFKNFNMDSLKV